MSPTSPLKPTLAAYDPLLTSQLLRVQRDLAVSLSGNIGLSDALRYILKTVTKVTEMDCGGIYLLDESNRTLILSAHLGLSPQFAAAIERLEESSPNFQLVMTGEAVYIQYKDIPLPNEEIRRAEDLQALAVIPVQHNNQVIACMNVASHSTTEIPPLTRNILEAISLQIATAIARLRTESQLREVEKRLLESELLFRNLIETTRAGIFILRDGKPIFANSAISEITGYPISEIFSENGRSKLVPNWKSQLVNLSPPLTTEKNQEDQQINPWIGAGIRVPSASEVEFITRSGDHGWVEISWGGYELSGSHYIIGIAVDITEQKRYARELAQRNQELTLLNIIAHQAGNLQNPDQMVLTVRDLLQLQLNVACGEILLLSSPREELRSVTRWGLSPPEELRNLAPLYHHKYIVRESELILIEDSIHPDSSIYKNMVRIPLLSSGEIQGYLDIYNNETYSCCTEEIAFLENLGRTVGMFIQNTRLFAQVDLARERFQAFSRRLVRVQEAERRHIARELHDEAGQSLTYILMGLDLLNRELSTPETARQRVVSLKKVTNDVMKELHNLATDLRPVGLDRFGLYVMLGQIVTLFRNELKMQVDFKFNGPTDKRLPLAMETALYRIVQEAFTNIARHSHARNVSLQFSLEDICVKLIIKDDGIGFDTSTLPGEGRLGLLGIQERVEMMGGTFVLESTPGKGTILLVEVPLDQKNLDR
jgi:PAS domain S-box-containing protein